MCEVDHGAGRRHGSQAVDETMSVGLKTIAVVWIRNWDRVG